MIDLVESLDTAVTTFLDLYETPGPFSLDPEKAYLACGPYLEPVETLNSARLRADPGAELEAAHQAVEEHWEAWQQDTRPAMQRFVAAVERRWLRVYTAAELLHKHFPQRRDIVPGLITEGVMLLAGKSGLGKSFWALQLGLAVAHGGKAFGAIDVAQGDVLYLSLEDDAPQMQERLAMCLEPNVPYPQALTIAHEAPLLSQGLAERLEAWLRTHEQARLIIVDVLQKIRLPRLHKGDIYEQDYAIGEALKPLARRYHVAILILHHCNKLVQPEDPLDAISGSTGLIAPADLKAVFTRARGEADAKLFITGRSVREQWVAFKFDEGQWIYLGDAQDYERSAAWQNILAFVNASVEPVSPKTVASCLALPHNTVKKLMWVMGRQGTLKQAGYGRYTSHTQNSGNSYGFSLGYEISEGEIPPVHPLREAPEFPRVPEAGTLQVLEKTAEFPEFRSSEGSIPEESGERPSDSSQYVSGNGTGRRQGVTHRRGWTWPTNGGASRP